MADGALAFAGMTACEIRAGVASGRFGALEVARAALARIEEHDVRVRAFLEVTAEAALQAARRVDAAVAAGRADELGPLAGVPVAFKDNLHLAGTRTTCASRMLEGFASPYTATCVQRVVDAGGIPLGKLNMDEFAFGSSTETSAFGRTGNPWDLERVPGGSSGGSAAAVAAGLATIALGSDAGGSIRQPASLCGVVGVKPSYGVVSRHGVVAFASSLDQVGPFTRSVEDAATVLGVLAGRDPLDGESRDVAIDFATEAVRGAAGMRVGVVPAFMEAPGLSPEMRDAVALAAERLEASGVRLLEVDLPHARAAMDAYCVLGPCEAFLNLGSFDPKRYGYREEAGGTQAERREGDQAAGFGAEARRRIARGAQLLSTDEGADLLSTAREVRALIAQDYDRAFERVDAILAPVTPRTAFKFGEITDPDEMHLSDMFTVSVNLAGNGAMSVPMGLGARSGLPVGVQIISPAMKDGNMLRVAMALERACGRARLAPAFAC